MDNGERVMVNGRYVRGRRCLRGAMALAVLWLASVPAFAGSLITGSSVSLSQLSHRYGFVSYDVRGKALTLGTRFDAFVFEGDTRKVAFNNTLVWLNAPVARRWGAWTIQDVDVGKTILPLVAPSRALKPEGYRIVVLDPGHGGADRGASNLRAGLDEKRINLELARDVRAILQKYRVIVYLTRAGDQDVELDQRCLLANRWRADLLVSIHLNSAVNSDSSGIETHILPPAGSPITASTHAGGRDAVSFPGNRHDAANVILGYCLQRSLLKHTRAEDRGVRRSRFYMVRNVNCPAALVECGFLSNRAEKDKLSTSSFRDALVRGIAEGIVAYLNAVRRAQGTPP
jgi:N-acetylmuramoyl-L-alanine amidase